MMEWFKTKPGPNLWYIYIKLAMGRFCWGICVYIVVIYMHTTFHLVSITVKYYYITELILVNYIITLVKVQFVSLYNNIKARDINVYFWNCLIYNLSSHL